MGKRPIACMLLLLIIFCFSIHANVVAQQIADEGIRNIVFAQLGITKERDLTKQELALITEIDDEKYQAAMTKEMDVFWRLKSIKSLEDLRLFPNLEKLVLTGTLYSLEGIQEAKNLKTVELHFYQAEDSYLVATLPKLENLVIYTDWLQPLTFLTKIKNLKSFILYDGARGSFGEENINCINGLTELEELHVFGFDYSELSILDLKNFPKLKRFAIQAGWLLEAKLEELGISGALEQMEAMMIDGVMSDRVLRLIARAKHLQKLDLFDSYESAGCPDDYYNLKEKEKKCSIDLSILKDCKELEMLILSQFHHAYNFNDRRVINLGKLKQIKDLRMYNCSKQVDLAMCSELENLKTLIINSCWEPIDISDLSKYGKLNNLKELETATNDVLDMEGIGELEGLRVFRYWPKKSILHPEALLDYKYKKEKPISTLYGYYYCIRRDGDYNQFYIFDK